MNRANPFDALLGRTPARLPATTGATVVVAGKKISDVRQIDKALPCEDDDEVAKEWAAKLRRQAEASRQRVRYQKDRLDPAKMAKREAWAEANREKRRAYKKAYDEANKARIRAQQSAWAMRKYYENVEAARAKTRAWYAANREKVLARLKAQRDAAKAAREQLA